MAHTNFFSFQYQLSCRSRSDSNCFIVTGRKKKSCGLPRISYFSKGFCADMQIKQRDAGDLFLFFSEVLSLSAKAEVANQLNLPILRSHSPWSKLNFRESLVPGGMHAFICQVWVAILFSHWVCLCHSGDICRELGRRLSSWANKGFQESSSVA